MKLTNKTMLYIYVVVVFIFTFLLTSKLILAFKINEFNYFKLGLNAVVLAYAIYKVIEHSKLENNK